MPRAAHRQHPLANIAALTRAFTMACTTAIAAGGGVACAPLPPGATAPTGLVSPGEERVLVGSFATVNAVAASRRFVYAAGPGGVAIFDRFTERWTQPPTDDLQRELGLSPAFDARTAGPGIALLVGDPVEDALWIGVPGAVIVYRPLTGQAQRVLVTGVPQRIVFERAPTASGEALVQSGGQWLRVSRVGIATPLTGSPALAAVVVPPSLADLEGRYPALRSQLQQAVAQLRRNAAGNRPLRSVVMRAAAASPDRAGELWVGTDGEGLLRVDPLVGTATAFPYGLREGGAGALAPAADGVWIAGLGLSNRDGGITFATTDLQRWRWIEGTITMPLAGVRAFAMVTRGAQAWVGTASGLLRVQLRGTEAMQRYGRLTGLPDDRVFAVAARDDGAWAGTAQGLAFVRDALPDTVRDAMRDPMRDTMRDAMRETAVAPGAVPENTVALRGVAVYALQTAGEVLWAGTEAGLVLRPADPAAPASVRRPGGTGSALRRPVRALALHDSVALVATDDAVYLLNARAAWSPDNDAAAVPLPLMEPQRVGPVTRVALDARTMALAGRDGLVLRDRAQGAVRVLRTPAELPGPVLDLLFTRDWLFLATPQGLVRLRRGADGLVP
ncbi:MAG: hypothetical protein LW840_12245 [Gemmatimonas sp.]|jgi:hypothetical protein|uniref:hypothetical protein n=1 Tax=Gemmatimonas sp. TaxID=1962908 RepID=UPI0025B7F0C2|nr:hypothetical protein [Gemmatimonas sp.]MCE2954465.1 hypothetical protein [Gemmatimonas sp.]